MKNVLFLILGMLLVSCSGGNGGQQPGQSPFGGQQRGTTVEVSEVSFDTITRQVRSYGTVRAQDNVRIFPQVSERVMQIHADLGDTVQQGQLLARLRDVTFRDAVRRDEAQLEQANIALNRDSLAYVRARQLHERELVSQTEYENARATFLNARANYIGTRASLTQSRENLNLTEIRSPVHGVITRRNISIGDVASSGNAIFEASNLLGYEVRINIPLDDRRQITSGQTVKMRISGEREFTVEGRVTRISPELDPVTGLSEVVISLTSGADQVFPGALVETAINVLTRDNTVVISRSALVENIQTLIDPESNNIRLERTYFAFVAQGDTLAVQRDLELGVQQGDRIEILSGLYPGDKLIITGQASLEDRARIRVGGGAAARGGQFGNNGRPAGQGQSNVEN